MLAAEGVLSGIPGRRRDHRRPRRRQPRAGRSRGRRGPRRRVAAARRAADRPARRRDREMAAQGAAAGARTGRTSPRAGAAGPSTWSAARGARSRGSTSSRAIIRCRSPTITACRPRGPEELRKLIRSLDKADPQSIRMLTASRIPTLPAAKMILSALVDVLQPSELIVSSFGIREGLLYDELSRDAAPARPADRGGARGGEGAQPLRRAWRPARPLDRPDLRRRSAEARIRLAACLLADVAWQAHPDFRAERGVEMALHGNWVGVDAAERVTMAQALFSNFGGGRIFPEPKVAALCAAGDAGARLSLGPGDAARPTAERRPRVSLERSRLTRETDASG